eukprot:jgi/Psemu1/327077/estExt_fgenesh1_pg.C_5350001
MTLEECEECKPPEDGDDDAVAYYFELPCARFCELSPVPTQASTALSNYSISSLNSEDPECFDDVMLIEKDTGDELLCEYSSQPLTIEELDDSGSNEVRFSFTNNWPVPMTNVELLFDRGDGLGQQLQSLNSLSRGAMYPFTLAAACDPTTLTTMIEVFVCNMDLSHFSSRSKCENSESGSCSFIYKVPCSVDVLCDGGRRLKSADFTNIEQGFMTEEMKAAAEPNDDSEDAPYCLHKDHPCEGEEENMVYVCHYSNQSGYQTFCIPEMDSDILRFSNDHHCGPCDGWNGVEQSGQMM